MKNKTRIIHTASDGIEFIYNGNLYFIASMIGENILQSVIDNCDADELVVDNFVQRFSHQSGYYTVSNYITIDKSNIDEYPDLIWKFIESNKNRWESFND